jgi:serine/threonine protein kinase
MVQRNSRLIGSIYQVGQVITSSSFLTTYSAYNRNTSSVVGLLVIDLPPGFNLRVAEQLLAPLERRREVQSPHVNRVYDWGISDGRAYIATDPPRGVTLRHLADTENIGFARSLDIAIQMTRGVAALQAHGIVDTDLRPQLITVDTISGQGDRVQIDDMGLRSIFRQLGYVQGQSIQDIEYLDPRYMPPESIYQGIIGSSSDVYQLGILLFELITGRPPFVGRTPAETGIMQSNSPVPRVAQFKHGTPPEIQEIIDRAMAKFPLQRYPHAAAMLAALEALPRPERKTVSGEWQPTEAQVSRNLLPAAKSVDLTNEMLSIPLDTDATNTLIETERKDEERQPFSTSLIPDDTKTYAYLEWEKAGEETQRIPIKVNYAIIGRIDPKRGITPEIDLTALDPLVTVSRQHARIRFEKTFFYIEDLKSRNRTRLGELVLKPLKPELLQHGDVICFGSVKMIFRVPGMPNRPIPKNMP